MKSATLTRHFCSSDLHLSDAFFIQSVMLPVCMFHTDDIIWEYLYSIWIGSFESRHFTLYRLSVRQRYTPSFALKFPETKTAESTSFFLSLFYKSTFYCYYECTQINVESLQIWKMYNSYLFDQKLQSILRAKERSGASICPAVSYSNTLHWHWIGHIYLD